jgi:integrase
MALARRRAPDNAERLWDAAANEISPKTRKAYAGEWRRFGQWWEDLDADEDDPELAQKALKLLISFPEPYVPREIVLRYKNWLDHEKPKRGYNAERGDPLGVAPATRARAIRAMNSMVEKLNFVGFVPWVLNVPSGGSAPIRNVKGPNQATWRRLLAHVKKNGSLEDLALIHTLRTLALRAHEVCKVRITDLDRGNQMIDVLGKGKKMAHLDVPDKVWDLFMRQARAQQKRAEDPVFLFGDPHQGVAYEQLYMRVKEWGAGIGIKLWPHALRHSGITRAAQVCVDGGMTVKELQKFSRHAKAETALGYIDALDDGGKKIADAMLED